MVWGMELRRADDDTRPEYIQALAMIAYEALGGMLSPFALRGSGDPAARYTPLATLSEEGNEVVRRALDRSRSFPSAQDFISALSKLDDPHVRRREPPHSARASQGVPPTPTPRPPGRARTHSTRARPGRASQGQTPARVMIGALVVMGARRRDFSPSLPAWQAKRSLARTGDAGAPAPVARPNTKRTPAPTPNPPPHASSRTPAPAPESLDRRHPKPRRDWRQEASGRKRSMRVSRSPGNIRSRPWEPPTSKRCSSICARGRARSP